MLVRRQRHVKELQKEIDYKSLVDTVHKKKFDGNGKKNVPQSSSGYGKSLIKNCKFCSYTHKRGNCSAYGKKCKNCLKPNHFAKCCPNKSANVKKKLLSKLIVIQVTLISIMQLMTHSL